MATIKEVRNALANQISASSGLTAKPYMPAQVNPPVIALMAGGPPYVKYGVVLGERLTQLPAVTDINLNVMIVVSQAGSYDTSQENLDAYIDFATSEAATIPEAIMADPTLGGLVEWCEPMAVVAPVIIPIAGVEYFTARISVEISLQQDFNELFQPRPGFTEDYLTNRGLSYPVLDREIHLPCTAAVFLPYSHNSAWSKLRHGVICSALARVTRTSVP